MDGEDGQRRELADFLAARRHAIRPEDVGLPAGPRRRTPGLRREEVAILAGVSPTWYTYLEQGRRVRPSAAVLDSLARVLRLTADERRYVHMLTLGQAPVRNSWPTPDDPPVSEELRDIMAVVGRCPEPVYITDWLCDILAWNAAAAEWYTDWGALPVDRRNMLWWLFHDPVARERVVDWEAESRDEMGRFRALSASRADHPRFGCVISELRRSPEFVTWWQDHEVAGARGRERELRHPHHGRRRFRLSVLYPSGQDERMVVLHPPAGSEQDGAA